MNERKLRATLHVTKALADMQRVRILMLLDKGELCVCQIVDVLGLAPSTISKHLSILSNAELVVSRKEGRWVFFKLPSGPRAAFVHPILRWLRHNLHDDSTMIEDRAKLATAMANNPIDMCES